MALRIDDISLNTIIGPGSTICGDIKINGFVRIDGDIDGNLETDGNVIIGENARIKGNVNAKSIIIGGIIVGNINAIESAKLLPESIVIGDIVSHKVQVADNSILHGHCISIKEDEEYQTTSQEYFQSRAIKAKVLV